MASSTLASSKIAQTQGLMAVPEISAADFCVSAPIFDVARSTLCRALVGTEHQDVKVSAEYAKFDVVVRAGSIRCWRGRIK